MMSNEKVSFSVLAVAFVLAWSSVLADDLTGADKLLCTPAQATRCLAEGDCEIGPPWNWNIPQFIEVDLGQKMLKTTKASGENRVTPIKNLERDSGKIFLQGIESGRAFSLVIDEETGFLSAAVAADGVATAIFGACTPLAVSK